MRSTSSCYGVLIAEVEPLVVEAVVLELAVKGCFEVDAAVRVPPQDL
ncbi:hypothetical protein H4W33_006503 [Kibdelosporangium phytohabitans]|nr:hypothetical protein [Kibdelosporangium phytohabitans]MBE1467491.1 hypothetical protein [Kibdelosporangium phytohabitans]